MRHVASLRRRRIMCIKTPCTFSPKKGVSLRCGTWSRAFSVNNEMLRQTMEDGRPACTAPSCGRPFMSVITLSLGPGSTLTLDRPDPQLKHQLHLRLAIRQVSRTLDSLIPEPDHRHPVISHPTSDHLIRRYTTTRLHNTSYITINVSSRRTRTLRALVRRRHPPPFPAIHARPTRPAPIPVPSVRRARTDNGRPPLGL